MTPGLTESRSPQHPSSKKVDLGKNEIPDNGPAKNPNPLSGSGAESEASAAQVESPSSEPDFFDEPLYPLRPGYTRRLIKKIYPPPEMWDLNFDEQEWMKKAYGERVIVVDMVNVPDGWILVDGNSSQNNICQL